MEVAQLTDPNAETGAFARQEAQNTAKAIAVASADLAMHSQLLADLKPEICRKAAELADFSAPPELIWDLAADLPDFETGSLYRARASLLSLASAVFLGWLLGGVLATVLGFLGLGGEIWRPAAILAALWLEDYLGANPRAKKILLTVLGLGALGRFAVALAAGMARFGSFRALIFGAGPRPNIFKSAWLWLGAFFLYVFFSKKLTGLDIAVFEASLEKQIGQRLCLCVLIMRALKEKDRQIELLSGFEAGPAGHCANKNCALAGAALALLDSLEGDQRRYLAGALRQSGFNVLDADADYLIWNSAEHARLYDPIGLVRDGDRCLILDRPHEAQGDLRKGRAQRVAQ